MSGQRRKTNASVWRRRLIHFIQVTKIQTGCRRQGPAFASPGMRPSGNLKIYLGRPSGLYPIRKPVFSHHCPDYGPVSDRRCRSSYVRLVIDTGRHQIGPFRPATADGPTRRGRKEAKRPAPTGEALAFARDVRRENMATKSGPVQKSVKATSRPHRPDAGFSWPFPISSSCYSLSDKLCYPHRPSAAAVAIPQQLCLNWLNQRRIYYCDEDDYREYSNREATIEGICWNKFLLNNKTNGQRGAIGSSCLLPYHMHAQSMFDD